METWFALRGFAAPGKSSSNRAAMHIVSESIQVLALPRQWPQNF
jgi:hypothetical protein